MRDPNRIPQVLNALALYWKEHPDLRLGQIISNAQSTHRINNGLADTQDVFYFEDEDLLKTLYELL